MLSKFNASPVLAVKDLAKGREFYEQTLGLGKPLRADEFQVIYTCGNGTIELYPSSFAGTNQATAVTWDVDDIEAVVEALKAKGVVFEHYDMPGVTLRGDIHDMGPEKAAWFKDPDGNILCLHQ